MLDYVLRLWGGIARDRRDLENIALRHQVDVLTRTRRRPALLLGGLTHEYEQEAA